MKTNAMKNRNLLLVCAFFVTYLLSSCDKDNNVTPVNPVDSSKYEVPVTYDTAIMHKWINISNNCHGGWDDWKISNAYFNMDLRTTKNYSIFNDNNHNTINGYCYYIVENRIFWFSLKCDWIYYVDKYNKQIYDNRINFDIISVSDGTLIIDEWYLNYDSVKVVIEKTFKRVSDNYDLSIFNN